MAPSPGPGAPTFIRSSAFTLLPSINSMQKGCSRDHKDTEEGWGSREAGLAARLRHLSPTPSVFYQKACCANVPGPPVPQKSTRGQWRVPCGSHRFQPDMDHPPRAPEPRPSWCASQLTGDTGKEVHCLTFLAGIGGGLVRGFWTWGAGLLCSSRMARMEDLWTMVRWGVSPLCRQLQMYWDGGAG